VLTDPILLLHRGPRPAAIRGDRSARSCLALRSRICRQHRVVVDFSHHFRSSRPRQREGAGPSSWRFAALLGAPRNSRRGWRTAGVPRAVELDWWDAHVHRRRSNFNSQFTPPTLVGGRKLERSQNTQTLVGSVGRVGGADFHWFFTRRHGLSRTSSNTRQRLAPLAAAVGGFSPLRLIASAPVLSALGFIEGSTRPMLQRSAADPP